MKINIHILILILFCQVNSLLPDNKRKEFFLKYIEKIPNDRIESINYFNSNYDDYDDYDDYDNNFYDYELESIPYDKKEIDNIISRYNFPASYNFSEEVEAKVNVKDQGHCGELRDESAGRSPWPWKSFWFGYSKAHSMVVYIGGGFRGDGGRGGSLST